MQIFGLKNCGVVAELGIYSKIASGHWNYMGVVSRLPIASPRHRPMETCYVH